MTIAIRPSRTNGTSSAGDGHDARRLRHQAKIALTGQEAVELARQFRPEPVFCDIGLPETDGYEVARRLRAQSDTAAGLLVGWTGWGTEDDKR